MVLKNKHKIVVDLSIASFGYTLSSLPSGTIVFWNRESRINLWELKSAKLGIDPSLVLVESKQYGLV